MMICQRPKLLIVDDDEDYLDDMKTLLSANFDIETASSSEQAVAAFQNTPPDCVLLDLNIPCYLGDDPTIEGCLLKEKLQNLQQARGSSSLPVIVVSSQLAENSGSQRRWEGINASFGKPVDVEKLIGEIRRCIEEITE